MQTGAGCKPVGRKIIAWQFLLWYYGIGCRKMPDTIKKAGRRMDRNVCLYDIMEIKKETSRLFQSEDLTQ